MCLHEYSCTRQRTGGFMADPDQQGKTDDWGPQDPPFQRRFTDLNGQFNKKDSDKGLVPYVKYSSTSEAVLTHIWEGDTAVFGPDTQLARNSRKKWGNLKDSGGTEKQFYLTFA
jgi:hypothetical protein